MRKTVWLAVYCNCARLGWLVLLLGLLLWSLRQSSYNLTTHVLCLYVSFLNNHHFKTCLRRNMYKGMEVWAILSHHFCYLFKHTPLLFSACWWRFVFCIQACECCLEGQPLMDVMKILNGKACILKLLVLGNSVWSKQFIHIGLESLLQNARVKNNSFFVPQSVLLYFKSCLMLLWSMLWVGTTGLFIF